MHILEKINLSQIKTVLQYKDYTMFERSITRNMMSCLPIYS